MRTTLALTLAFALGAACPAALAQTLPVLPSGFQADQQAAQAIAPMRAAGVADGVRGTKANDTMSPCFSDPKIVFGFGWTLNPAGKTIIDAILKAPQDPASKDQSTLALDEPVSK